MQEIFKIILLLEFSLSLAVFCEIYSSFLLPDGHVVIKVISH